MIGVYIRPASMTVDQYKSIDEQVRAAVGDPEGMLMHSCFSEGESIAIFDVWESEDAFRAFAAALGPIVEASGVEPVEPMIVSMIAFQTP